MSDYQVKVENDWIASLREKYQVSINQEILDKVRAQINN